MVVAYEVPVGTVPGFRGVGLLQRTEGGQRLAMTRTIIENDLHCRVVDLKNTVSGVGRSSRPSGLLSR